MEVAILNNYAYLYSWMLNEFKDPYKAIIYAFVYSFSKNGGVWFGSQETMAKMTGISRKTINQKMRELDQEGYIYRNIVHKTGFNVDMECRINYEKAEEMEQHVTESYMQEDDDVMNDDIHVTESNMHHVTGSNMPCNPELHDHVTESNIINNPITNVDNKECITKPIALTSNDSVDTDKDGSLLGVNTEEKINNPRHVTDSNMHMLPPDFGTVEDYLKTFSFTDDQIRSVFKKAEDSDWFDSNSETPIINMKSGWKGWMLVQANRLLKEVI